jgi:hypothetical protein
MNGHALNRKELAFISMNELNYRPLIYDVLMRNEK